jgi:hypothetical protein
MYSRFRILMFIGGLDWVPAMTQQIARLHDIARRVADEPQGNVNCLEGAGMAAVAEPGARA